MYPELSEESNKENLLMIVATVLVAVLDYKKEENA